MTRTMSVAAWIFYFSFAGSMFDCPAATADESPQVDFARQIQPIFARRCYKCHGPNEDEAGLRLSTRDAALAELESGEFAVVAGDTVGGTLLQRLRSEDDDERMPPEGKPLSEEEIQLVEQWIKAGAKWAEHWSFRRPQRSAIPQPKDRGWVRNPIDAFILSRLEEAGLQPAPPAEKVALIRRAYYDLTGLPPTPAQVDAFVADKSPRAFERLVDRLLDSPHYGEKWARHWLDLVRYAETNGYERDSRKDLIWKYRDYVIRSFNEDKPFDRFAMEQIAGDEVPDKDADSITATGFYRLGIWDDEPADREQARYDYLDDILRTTGEAFLAVTIGCARCHDHKIDPIAQKDYYSMLSFFADISPHGKGRANHVQVSASDGQGAYQQKLAAKQRLESALQKQIDAFERDFRDGLAKKHPELAVPAGPSKSAGDEVLVLDSIKSGQPWEYTVTRPGDNWFEIAFDDSRWKTSQGGFGRQGTPGAVVRTTWDTADIWLRKDFRLGSVPGNLTLKIHHDEDAEVYLNGKLIATLTGHVRDYETLDVTEAAADVLQTGRNTLAIHCRQTSGGQYIDAGLVVGAGGAPLDVLVNKYGVEVLGKPKTQLWKQTITKLANSKATRLKAEEEYVMAVAERGRQKTWILGRGNHASKQDEVGPAFPQIFDPPAAEVPPAYNTKATSGKRRVLAEWIASKDNPATARVIVNRIWQHHFGRGLVRSTSDFGFQGLPPTHPQLLDWLAVEMVENGWRMKAMHKLMMMSNTYQMSSAGNAKALAKDPTNNLFWRFNMRRLTAEEIRDSILTVGGTLNSEMFGDSVFPPLPQEVLATSSKPGSAWGRSTPEQAARRSVYVHVKRSLRPPMMANFDVPDTDSSCSARLVTTVPTQALGMLNSKFMTEQAVILADRLRQERPDDLHGQIATAIRLTTGRQPTDNEIKADTAFIEALTTEEELSADDALRDYCLLILNTNEFVYLD